MSRPKLLAFQLLVALVTVLLWQLFTTVPIGGVKLLLRQAKSRKGGWMI